MSSTTTTSNNSYSADRSHALAELQSNYGMPGGLSGYRLPTLEKPSKTAEADLTPSSSDDGASFSTSSTANSSISKASLKAKAASFFKFASTPSSSSTTTKGNKRQAAAALAGLENDSMATLISTTSSSASQKPDPALVFAHMSSTYGVAGHGFSGYKIPNLENQDRRSSSSKKSARVQPARGTPEAVLAELLNSYGAPARSQLVSHT
ncbi:hypothetical protein OC861_001686 [Tilletia horrida]|nr:hypothetical protein OC861_001686 [Tilletia horrida]